MIAKPIASWLKDNQKTVEAQKATKTVKRQSSWRLCPFVSSWVICACSSAALEAPSSPTRTPWILLWSTCTAAEDASVYLGLSLCKCEKNELHLLFRQKGVSYHMFLWLCFTVLHCASLFVFVAVLHCFSSPMNSRRAFDSDLIVYLTFGSYSTKDRQTCTESVDARNQDNFEPLINYDQIVFWSIRGLLLHAEKSTDLAESIYI